MAENDFPGAGKAEPAPSARLGPPARQQMAAPLPSGPRRLPLVHRSLPFLSSFVFHALLIVLGLAAAQTVPKFRDVVKEQIIIPDAQLVERPQAGPPVAGLGSDPGISPAHDFQLQDSTPSAQTGALRAGPGGDRPEGLIGVGGGGTLALRPGSGSGTDSSSGGAPFGVPGGSGSLPRINFMGQGGNARRIVFLVDGSATMLPALPMLKRELQLTISKLQPSQSFNVVVFRGDKTASIADFPDLLVAATQANKSRAYRWIREDLTVAGGTNPFPAIEKAFAMAPELVFVLTDGFDDASDDGAEQAASYARLEDAFRQANHDHKAKVMTLFLKSSGSDNAALRGLLERIAAGSGGKFSAVSSD